MCHSYAYNYETAEGENIDRRSGHGHQECLKFCLKVIKTDKKERKKDQIKKDKHKVILKRDVSPSRGCVAWVTRTKCSDSYRLNVISVELTTSLCGPVVLRCGGKINTVTTRTPRMTSALCVDSC